MKLFSSVNIHLFTQHIYIGHLLSALYTIRALFLDAGNTEVNKTKLLTLWNFILQKDSRQYNK